MNQNNVFLTVYGAEQICASCVGAPGSKDTFEWLQAAISRKYGREGITYKYVDIFNPPEDPNDQELARRIVDDEFFYPLILVNGEVVGEGNPRLKTIYQALEKQGITEAE
ncbi:YuzD family protein [Sediminibacillus massiliensis]|uniref:YuzD family protein n=1 Tax=Sediminibacillus massiliensis TaxID=1926277 RepID=UPI00098872F6|nr:YuzD family protein [Sediminibacillus massiliensis]